MTTAFDRSLEIREVMTAAEEHARLHGEPGSWAYRTAWLQFLRRIRTVDDLWRRRDGPRASSRDLLNVLTAALERVMAIDGASIANAQLLDARGRLQIVAHTGFGAEFLEFFRIVDDPRSACGSALRSARPVWVGDVTQSPIFAGTPALEVMNDAGSRAVASIPLISGGGRLIGMISTHHNRRTSWTQGRRQGLMAAASLTGRLLEHLAPAATLVPAGQSGQARLTA
jgi:GAF domain-containing protein